MKTNKIKKMWLVMMSLWFAGCGTGLNRDSKGGSAPSSGCSGALSVCGFTYSERNLKFNIVAPAEAVNNYEISLCSPSGCFDSAWVVTCSNPSSCSVNTSSGIATVVANGSAKVISFTDSTYAILGTGGSVKVRATGAAGQGPFIPGQLVQ